VFTNVLDRKVIGEGRPHQCHHRAGDREEGHYASPAGGLQKSGRAGILAMGGMKQRHRAHGEGIHAERQREKKGEATKLRHEKGNSLL
jgi:hypothetical protein